MEFRYADESDAPFLADINRQLIQDEWGGEGMSLARLEERMRRWITPGRLPCNRISRGGKHGRIFPREHGRGLGIHPAFLRTPRAPRQGRRPTSYRRALRRGHPPDGSSDAGRARQQSVGAPILAVRGIYRLRDPDGASTGFCGTRWRVAARRRAVPLALG